MDANSVDRRDALKVMGIAAGAAVVVGSSGPAHEPGAPAWTVDPSQPYAEVLAAPHLNAVFGALATPGYRLADCRVVAVCRVNAGGVPFILADPAGRHFQVDVLRRDARAGLREAVAATDELAVYLLNEGSGDSATLEQHGLAAMALARELDARRTRAGAIRGLLTLEDRHLRFPAGVYRLLA